MTLVLIGIAGGAASGKSTLARCLAECLPYTEILSLDDFALTDRTRGPFTPPDEQSRTFFDLNHPASIDLGRVLDSIRDSKAEYVVVEGLFALAYAELREPMALRVFVQADDDVRLGRKIVRNFEERGQAPDVTLRNYLNSGKPGHQQYVTPTIQHADLVQDGEKPPEENAGRVLDRLRKMGF